MSALNAAVNTIAIQVTDPKERQHYIGLLEEMVKDCKAATDVWNQYLQSPGAPPKDPDSLMAWTGPDIAKKLFQIHLNYRAKMLAVTNNGGDLEDPVIEMAYRHTQPGETGQTAAQAAVDRLKTALSNTRVLIEKINTTVPKKMASKPTSSKIKPIKKLPVKKTVQKKAIEKASKKKSLVKKSPGKKAAVKKSAKPAVKKKSLVKKSAPKKGTAKNKAVKKTAKKK